MKLKHAELTELVACVSVFEAGATFYFSEVPKVCNKLVAAGLMWPVQTITGKRVDGYAPSRKGETLVNMLLGTTNLWLGLEKPRARRKKK